MKPSIILYTKPCLMICCIAWRRIFTVTQVPNLHSGNGKRNTRRHLPARKAFWAPAKPLTARCWKKCRRYARRQTISVGYDNVRGGRPYCPQNSPDAHACRFDGKPLPIR
ncbi:Uncharacterised protein [Salmonella enterica subsp. enterica]|uniref:Uncharacterized protein n=1 Tax=Salmonella enterica I TaxID=59201 RepID=A0A3S4HYR0_SALET|nr:Uncharacterised protein [Salmonella enterica subsp. enterica]